MIIRYFFIMLLMISTFGDICDDLQCSHVDDYVCGMAEAEDGTQIIMKYKNICYMWQKACEMESLVAIKQVADKLCNIKKRKKMRTRRVNDFSIVGAHQVCNHTCPTYCTDTYEPACAQIRYPTGQKMMKPMVNHCHIDMFSCVAGVNVTVMSLFNCLSHGAALAFMQNMAGLKSLHLLDEVLPVSRRRTNDVEPYKSDGELLLREHLLEVVRRIFNKFKGLGVPGTPTV